MTASALDLQAVAQQVFAALAEGFCPTCAGRLQPVPGSRYGYCQVCGGYWASCTAHRDEAEWEFSWSRDVTLLDLYGHPVTHYADLGEVCAHPERP